MTYRDKRTLAIVTARGGSKGVFQKNIHDFCGRPLIAYTLDAARDSEHLTRCIVSTDDEGIAEHSRQHGGDVPFMRPPELATDQSLALDVLQHAVQWVNDEQGEEYDYIMMLHPTSPLRTAEDIDGCIKMIVDNGADSVMSMKRVPDFSAKKLKVIKDGKILPFLEPEGRQSDPRHLAPTVYKRNCAVYLTKTELIMQGEQFGEKSMAYVMPEERSIDINEPVDFALAEFWLRRAQRQAAAA